MHVLTKDAAILKLKAVRHAPPPPTAMTTIHAQPINVTACMRLVTVQRQNAPAAILRLMAAHRVPWIISVVLEGLV